MRSLSRHPRYAAAAAALAAGAFVVATGAASASPGDSSMSSSAMPSASGSTSGQMTTLHLYSVAEMSNLYSPAGQVIANPNTAPVVGSYVVSTDADYTGNHTSHGTAVVGTDHLYCVITQAPATAVCSAEIATANGSMLVSDHSTQNLNTSGTMTFPITGGTGSYAGAHGTVTVTPVANTSNADFTVTYTK